MMDMQQDQVLIKDVFGLLYRYRQYVGFELAGFNKAVFIPFESVKRQCEIGIEEIEILTGCFVEPIFFEMGERLPDGNKNVVNDSTTLLKGLKIELSHPLTKLREVNTHFLKSYKRINKVFEYVHKGKPAYGFEVESQSAIFFKKTHLQGITGLTPQHFEKLEGSYVNPEYYLSGQPLGLTELCAHKDDTLVYALRLRLSKDIEPFSLKEGSRRSDLLVGSLKLKRTEWLHFDGYYGGYHGNDDITFMLTQNTSDNVVWKHGWWSLVD